MSKIQSLYYSIPAPTPSSHISEHSSLDLSIVQPHRRHTGHLAVLGTHDTFPHFSSLSFAAPSLWNVLPFLDPHNRCFPLVTQVILQTTSQRSSRTLTKIHFPSLFDYSPLTLLQFLQGAS